MERDGEIAKRGEMAARSARGAVGVRSRVNRAEFARALS
jgi:hypothetical protein